MWHGQETGYNYYMPIKDNKGLYHSIEKTPYTESASEIKETFKFCTKLAQDHFNSNPRNSLDVGCANGALTQYLSQIFSSTQFIGIDVTPQFILEAQKLTIQNAKFYEISLEELYAEYSKANTKFDFITCVGTLGMLENPYDSIKWLVDLTKKSGMLIIEANFNSNDFDVRIEYRKHSGETLEPWQYGLDQISMKAVASYLDSLNLKFEFIPMPFNQDIKKTTDYSTPRWYTEEASINSKDKYLYNDLGMRMKHTFLRIIP